MKTYIVTIETIDDTFEDIQEFVYNEFSRLEDIELVEQFGNNYRCEITTQDDFDYNTFEDVMDNAGYDTEFIELYE